jgi:hypothetical protein
VPSTHQKIENSETPETSETSEDEDDGGEWYWCHATTRRGKRCIAFPVKDSTFCAGHDPAMREKVLDAASRGGRTSARKRRDQARRLTFAFENLALTDRANLQLAIDALFRLELTGQLPASRSRQVTRILAVAARNLTSKNAPVIRQARCSSPVSPIDRDLLKALAAASEKDDYREVREIQRESALRQQLARDIDDFPALDRRPAASRKLDNFPISAREYADRYGA